MELTSSDKVVDNKSGKDSEKNQAKKINLFDIKIPVFAPGSDKPVDTVTITIPHSKFYPLQELHKKLKILVNRNSIFNRIEYERKLEDIIHKLKDTIQNLALEKWQNHYYKSKFSNLVLEFPSKFDKRTFTNYHEEYPSMRSILDTIKGRADFVPIIHSTKNNNITCKDMNNANSTDPLKCPIYYRMKIKYEFNEKNLNHLYQFNHFSNVFDDKPKCKYGSKCKAFVRSLNMSNNRFDDKCHLELYRHPPRDRQIKLGENVHTFVQNDNFNIKKNRRLYKPTESDKKKYKFDEEIGFANALIEEVISNGYKRDLCLTEDDEKTNQFTLLDIVNEKLKHPRHVSMFAPLTQGQMLALILYTGCDCNYDLCAKQRKDDFRTWKWFDYCLWNAINALNLREDGKYCVYSGLNSVKLNKSKTNGTFRTYVSTSWKKEVALNFMGDKGMILEFDEECRQTWFGNTQVCCDVSWISKFPDECEILFARSIEYGQNAFKMEVTDEGNIQKVKVKAGFTYS